MLIIAQDNELILKGEDFDWLQEINEDGYEFVLDENGKTIRGVFLSKNNNTKNDI